MLPIFSAALPEIFLLTMVLVVLLADLFWGKKANHLGFGLSMLTLVVLIVLFIKNFNHPTLETFNGAFISDRLSTLLKLATCILTFLVFGYGRNYNRVRHIPELEFLALALLSLLGAFVLISAGSLLTVYLGLELLSLPLYAMIAMHRDAANSIEAAMKYFILGAIASGFLLYGFSLIYGVTGQLNLSQIALVTLQGSALHPVFIFGLIFSIVGITFKLGVVPFHMWVPDAYEGSPNSVTAYLGSVPKLAAFAMLVRVVVQGMPNWQMDWHLILLGLAWASLILANLVAVVQTNFKRLLGYSAIANMGFILVALSLGTTEGNRAALFYTLVYAFTTVGAFGIILAMTHAGFEADKIEDFKGLNKRNSWLAFLMLLLLFSMAGIPPLVGFEGKLFVLNALMMEQHYRTAVLLVLMSVIGAYYYIKVIKAMYFEDPAPKAKPTPALKSGAVILSSLNGLAVLALGLFPYGLYQLCMAVF
ncbi:MAG: NADH-quinone oxidoreductase subunit NuoN [Gammaproteobacteria bacterium]|nr:NADH-quinone oxidoreductase subunit NuoN [Gammaproteobacteria bacterium]